ALCLAQGSRGVRAARGAGRPHPPRSVMGLLCAPSWRPTEEVDRWISEVADDMQEGDPSLSRVVAEVKARDMLAWEWKYSSTSLTGIDFHEAEAAAALIERQTGVPRKQALGQVLRHLRESRASQNLRVLVERPLPCQRVGK